MRKLALILSVFLLLTFLLSACKGNDDSKNNSQVSPGTITSNPDDSRELKDGTYSATAEDYDDKGFKPTVDVTVKDNKVTAVNADELSRDGANKKAQSESGQYGMKEKGKSQGEWHEEIVLFERFVVENGLDKVSYNQDGKTDAITGCTVSVGKFAELIDKALEKAKK